MTTHPPGQPSGPTGPGRQIPTIAEHYETGTWGTNGDITGADCACGQVFTGPDALDQLAQHIKTPGPADAVLRPSDGPGIDPMADLDAELDRHAAGIGEPAVHSLLVRPRLGEVIRDAERLIRCALIVLDRPVDPASYPQGGPGHVADARFEVAGFHLEAAMRELGGIAALPLPAAGSAVRPPVLRGDEPTPGSAAARRGAGGEGPDPASLGVGPGADPDFPPDSAAPVSLPGRGVGPGVLGPT